MGKKTQNRHYSGGIWILSNHLFLSCCSSCHDLNHSFTLFLSLWCCFLLIYKSINQWIRKGERPAQKKKQERIQIHPGAKQTTTTKKKNHINTLKRNSKANTIISDMNLLHSEYHVFTSFSNKPHKQ